MKDEDEKSNASKVENQDEKMLEKSAYPLTQTEGDFQNSENQDATKKSRHENLIDNGSEEQQDPLDPHVVIAGEEVAQQPVEAKDHQRKEVEETLLETLDVATASDHDPDSSQTVEDAGTNESSPNEELHQINVSVVKNPGFNVEKQSDKRADMQDITPEVRCTVNEDERIELLPELESQEIVDQQTIDPQSGGERLYDPSYGVFAEMEEKVMRQLKVAKNKASDDVQNQEKRIYRPSKKQEDDGKTTDWAAKRLKRIMNCQKWNATSRAKYQAMTPEQRRNYRNRKPMMKNEEVKSNASKMENEDGKMLEELEKPQDHQAQAEETAPKKFKLSSFFPLTFDN